MNENTNTLDRLRRMNAPTGAVSEEIVQQDLARGRAAVAHAHRALLAVRRRYAGFQGLGHRSRERRRGRARGGGDTTVKGCGGAHGSMPGGRKSAPAVWLFAVL